MREIKFRAWDKLTQKYWNIEKWHFEDEYLDLIESGVSIADPNSERVWRKFNEVELMQYTGLTDANGNKIFEGDIVVVVSQYWGQLRNRYEVKFEQGAFYAGYFLLSKIAPSISVIGNIHENPELLEE